MPNSSQLKTIRQDFPMVSNSDLVYLDTAATSQKPYRVIERMNRFLQEENATVRRGLYKLCAKSTKAFDEARSKLAKFINAASPNEIIFCRGTTEAINLVATCLANSILEAGDEILISGLEHHANIVPWQLAASRWADPSLRSGLNHKTLASSIKIRSIPVLDDGSLDLNAYATLIQNPKIKILAICHVSNSTGSVIDIKSMIQTAKKAGVIVLVDGAQAVQHMKVDVQDLDADFYAFSGHKLYGPTGIGVLYMKNTWAERLSPYHGGGEMIENVSFEETSFASAPYKFEAGTPAIVEAIGLGEAIDYLEDLGMDAISQHEAQLAEYALSQMLNVTGLQVLGKSQSGDFLSGKKASLISFYFEDIEIFDLAILLNEENIAIRVGHHCAQPLMRRFGLVASARMSLGIYNNEEDIDLFVKALNKVTRILRA